MSAHAIFMVVALVPIALGLVFTFICIGSVIVEDLRSGPGYNRRSAIVLLIFFAWLAVVLIGLKATR